VWYNGFDGQRLTFNAPGEEIMSQRLMYGIGQICKELGQPDSRVRRIIATRRIEPVGFVGSSRVFGPDALVRVKEEIKRIDAARADRTAAR
jgi:hypothetical protein